MARRARGFAFAVLLTLPLLLSSVAAVSAHADKFIWKYTNAACYSDGMAAKGVVIEQGTSGTTWMLIAARFQRLVNGSWRTTQTDSVQSSVQFYDDHSDHKLTNTFNFYNASADYSYWTRISFRYDWYNDDTRIERHTLNTGRC